MTCELPAPLSTSVCLGYLLLQSICHPWLELWDPLLFVSLSPRMAQNHRGQLWIQNPPETPDKLTLPSSSLPASPSPTLLVAVFGPFTDFFFFFFQIDFGFLA